MWWKAAWLEWVAVPSPPSTVGSGQQSSPDPLGEHWGLLGVQCCSKGLPRGDRNLQRQLNKRLWCLFAAQCVKMQNSTGLRKTFLLLFVFSGKAPSGRPGFSCASHTCQLCRQGPIKCPENILVPLHCCSSSCCQ